MNEQIRLLMKQAGTDTSGKWMGIDHAKKFAELIVRECAEVAQMNTPDTEECEYTHLISEKIKEHFGVEE
jgi:hypothetical protein